MATRPRLDSADFYAVGWIAALPHERAAATAMLDEEHSQPKGFTKNAADQNHYTWGRIGLHNVVIASLPSGRYGVTTAAVTAHTLMYSLPHVHIGLLVGIGAGIPGEVVDRRSGKIKTKRDIRLGDVVIGEPDGNIGGMVQHDLVKVKEDGSNGTLRERKGFLNSPPDALLNALGALRSRHAMEDSQMPKILAEALDRFPKMKRQYKHPSTSTAGTTSDEEQDSDNEAVEDRLFEANYSHMGGDDCQDCDSSREIKRKTRISTSPKTHYGIIASENTLVKNAKERDELIGLLKKENLDALCIEMEAAGLMNSFPCLVIRGICDYGDSHMNDRWQRYAALTAAAFAKEFLTFISTNEVATTQEIGELLDIIKDTRDSVRAVSRQMGSVGGNVRALIRRSTRPAAESENRSLRGQTLLNKLSTYDYERVLRQARKNRCDDTGKWFLNTPQLQSWRTDPASSVLWLSGRLGCGKTVLVGKLIDHLPATYPTKDAKKTYFFCRSEIDDSLQATTILRSLIRQCLDVDSLPKAIERQLEEVLRSPILEADDLEPLLKAAVLQTPLHFIIIDGTDDCSDRERAALFKVLRNTVTAASTRVKVLLTSRNKIPQKFERAYYSTYHIIVDQMETNSDIAKFVDSALTERIEDGSLAVGSQALVKEVRDTLIANAKGMFLWVTLQLFHICDQTCDEDIRATVRNLPQDLVETYLRSLSRIESNRKTGLASQIFRWIAVARRPLTLPELQEALAVEPYAADSNPERKTHNLDLIPYWCEGLLFVDEEDLVVEFTHPTVLELLQGQSRPSVPRPFALTKREADKEAGIICVTYLNFNDFKTQLIQASTVRKPTPTEILEGSTPPGLSAKLIEAFRKRGWRRTQPKTNTDLSEQLSRLSQAGTQSASATASHPFLSYASKHWLFHATDFEESDRIWPMWERLLRKENDVADFPSDIEDFSAGGHAMLDWVVKNDHAPILAYYEKHGSPWSQEDLQWMLDKAAACNSIHVLQILCTDKSCAGLQFQKGLVIAARKGHVEVLDRILSTKADVNVVEAYYNGRTALQAAAEDGHLHVVERLLAANANVNAAAAAEWDGRTALQAAAGGGYLDVVERLLAAKADANAAAAAGWDGRTALQAAAGGGHLDIVERLLAANADVNAAAGQYKRTALQAAAGGGHLDVVERLLAAKADVHTVATVQGRRTALQAAAGGGHLDVVERLLAAKTDVYAAAAAGWDAQTALEAAARGGYLDVVEKLLAAKADVNAAAAAKWDGQAALEVAAGWGHLDIVEKLLAAK